MRFESKYAVVTGAARGIGLEVARRLVGDGARVLLCDLDAESGGREAEALGASAAFLHMDVSNEADWDRLIKRVAEDAESLDVMVNSAGVSAVGNIENLKLDVWQRTMDVNLNGTFLGTQYAIRAMRELPGPRGGAIVNVASITGLVGAALSPAYSASKGAVRLLSKSAALHCARSGYGIRVNCVCPGYVDGDFLNAGMKKFGEQAAQQFVDAVVQRTPMGRLASVQEVAGAILYLASDEASYVTGTDLIVDGGYTAS